MEFIKKVTQRLRQVRSFSRLRKEDGLINTTDLLVATAATVILAAGITGATLSALDAANYGKAQPDAQTIANGINQFYQDTGKWPGQVEHAANNTIPQFLATGTIADTYHLPEVASNGLKYATQDPCGDNSGQGFVQLSVGAYDSSVESADLDSISTAVVKNLNDFLVRDPNPASGTPTYPGWAGPYVQEIADDPWNHAWVAYLAPLYCSEDVSGSATSGGDLGYAWLLTGGSNGTITSPATGSGLDDGGDDAGVNLGKLTSTQVSGISQ